MARLLPKLALFFSTSLLLGSDFGFQPVEPQLFETEKKKVEDSWVLQFTFRNPRYVMAEIPGRGKRLVWYMRYKVSNPTEKPRLFIPKFTLVAHTRDGDKVYEDTVLPKAEQAVINTEEPGRTIELRNSVTVADEVPVTPKDSKPVEWQGVAFWENVDMNARSFTVYVTGLSNLYTKQEDPETKKEIMRQKTLKLEFSKPGDIFYPDHKEIRFVSQDWIYR